jgi:hypothetical protein
MNKYLLLALPCLMFTALNDATAQNGLPPMAGARGMAMGNASVTFRDINSAFSNQAGLAHLEGMAFTLGAERRFLLADINSYSAAFAYPTQSGTFGLALNYFGFSAYNEQRIGLAYGRKLLDNLSIGAQVDYLSTRIEEYGNTSNVTFEVGLQATLLKNAVLAAHVFSPIRQDIVTDEPIPTVLKVGIGYTPSDKVTLSAEMEKDIDFDPVFKAGIEYYIVDALALRTGFSSNPSQNSFGFGLRLKSGLHIDVAAAYHYQLGVTPMFSISYQAKNAQ